MANSLSKLSAREKNLVGFLFLVVALMPVFVFTLPAWREYNQVKDSVNSNSQKTRSLESKIKKLIKLKSENSKLTKKIDKRKQFLAKSYEIDFLVQDLKAICDESSVSLESFTPSEIEPLNIVLEKQLEAESQGKLIKSKVSSSKKKLKDETLPIDLYRLPIEVKIIGNFRDLVELFSRLEKYGRVISVENISIGKIQAKKRGGTGSGNRYSSSKTQPKKQENVDKGTLYTSFDLVAYSLPREEEVIPFKSLERSIKSSFKYKKSSVN